MLKPPQVARKWMQRRARRPGSSFEDYLPIEKSFGSKLSVLVPGCKSKSTLEIDVKTAS